MALFKKKGAGKVKSEHYIALDVGTEFIKCLIFRKEHNSCFVLGKGKVKHTIGSMRGGMIINIPQAIPNLKKAIDMATNMAGVSPKNLIISLPGDLVKSLVTTVHYHRLHPESHLDSSELKNIIYKVQWKAYEQIRSLISQQQEEPNLDVKLINTSVIDVRIDGYKIDNPLGFQGGKVTLSIFNAFAPLVHLGALQAVADELDLDLISVAAGPYAFGMSLASKQSEFNAIFIDIGAYTTDIVVVSEGGIVGIQNFALGGHAFNKFLSQVLKVSSDKIEKIKIDYAKDNLHKKSRAQLKEVFKATALTWVGGVAAALSEFTHLDVLPNRILISGGGANLPEIKNALMTKDWTRHLPFAKKPYPSIVELDEIDKIVIENNLQIDLSDTVVLGLAYLTLETDLSEDIVSTMLRRIILSMQA